MLPLVFIGNLEMLIWLSGEHDDPARSPEDLLIEIEDALSSNLIAPEQLEELLANFTRCDMRRPR